MDPKLLLDIVETLNVRSLEAILPQQIQGRIKEVVQYIFQYPDRHVQYLLKLLQAAFPELSDNDLPGIVNQMVAWVMQIRCKNPIGFQMMEGFCGQAHVTKSCRKQWLFAVGLDVVHGDQFCENATRMPAMAYYLILLRRWCGSVARRHLQIVRLVDQVRDEAIHRSPAWK